MRTVLGAAGSMSSQALLGPGAAWWLPALEWEEGRQVSLTTLPLSFSSLGKGWPRLFEHSADGRHGTERRRSPVLAVAGLVTHTPPSFWKLPLPDPHICSLFLEALEGLPAPESPKLLT